MNMTKKPSHKTRHRPLCVTLYERSPYHRTEAALDAYLDDPTDAKQVLLLLSL